MGARAFSGTLKPDQAGKEGHHAVRGHLPQPVTVFSPILAAAIPWRNSHEPGASQSDLGKVLPVPLQASTSTSTTPGELKAQGSTSR